MRLKKLSLIAAAGLTAVVGLSAAVATAKLDEADRTFGSDIAVGELNTLTIHVEGAATWAGKLTGAVQNPNSQQPMLNPGFSSGAVVKTGAGTLQLDSYKNIAFYQGSFLETRVPSEQVMLSDASQGLFRIKEGTVEVGGYINQYVVLSEFDDMLVTFPLFQDLSMVGDTTGNTRSGYLGFSSTVLEGNSRISFTNTPMNVPSALPTIDGAAPDFPPVSRVKRLNFIVNLKAGDNHTEVNTRLNVGQTEDMRLICDVTEFDPVFTTDPGIGSIGILEGQGGRFIKTGEGEFRLLNKATYTGNVIAEGGTLSVMMENSLDTVRSVSVGSSVDPRGLVYRGIGNSGTREFSPFIAPPSPFAPTQTPGSPPAYAAKLKLESNQRINNFQSIFSTYDVVTGAASHSITEVYGVGTGKDAAVDIADGKTITLLQTYNGYYTGKFISTYRSTDADLGTHTVGEERLAGQGGGYLVKYGAAETVEDAVYGDVYSKGTLVLTGAGSVYRGLDIREGVVFANAQSLGSGDVTVGSGGTLRFIQNEVGTLNAVLHGVGNLTFAKVGYLMSNGAALDGGDPSNGEPVVTTIGDGQIGTVDVRVAQTDFNGSITVQDGLQLRFGVASGDAFRNASAITLLTGENGEETALTFNDSNQTFRNFSGEKNTRVDLGQGNITIVQDGADLAYEGKITGSGGLIKDGAKALTLSGRDEQGNSVTTYAGATVVKAGTLNLGGANQLPNTSGLVMTGGTINLNGAQTFGALIGRAGATLNIGANDLTIGLSPERLAQVRAGIGAITAPDNSFYLATTGSSSLNNGQVNGYGADTTAAYIYNKAAISATVSAITNAKSAFDDAAANPGDAAKREFALKALKAANTALDVATVWDIDVGDAAHSGVIAAGQTAKAAVAAAVANALTSLENGFANAANISLALNSTATNEATVYVTTMNAAVTTLTDNLVFAGNITGTGGLIKQGAERLILTGVNTYTGDTLINGGTLQVNLGSIDSTNSVTVASGATFAVNVDSGSGSFSRNISGAGNFEKTGAGTLTLDPAAINYTGTTTVSGGVLGLTLTSALTGAINIGPAGTLALNQTSDLTIGTAVTGSGILQKDGGALLHLTNTAGFTGAAVVNAGVLQVDSLSESSIQIAAGATFLVTPGQATPPVLSIGTAGLISGDGTFAVQGTAAAPVTVTFNAVSSAFTGTLSGLNATIRAGVNDFLPAGAMALSNSVFDLAGTTQHLGAFSGDAASSIQLGGGSLHFAPAEGVDATFDGKILGNGSIVKDGSGTQRLATPENTGWTGTTVVNEGTLVATVDALGASDLTINAGTNASFAGTLAFYNPDADNPTSYDRAISGDGTIGKVGAGVVNLTNDSALFTGSILVSEGELRIDTPAGTLGGNLFGDTSVTSKGIYALVMAANTDHDSLVTGDRVSDASPIDGVTQHGSLAVEGGFTFTLSNGQSYTGNTILRNGATLDLVNSTGLNGVLNGLAGDATSTVRTDGAALTLVQSVDGLFSGIFNVATDIVVQGPGKLAMDNLNNNLAGITVDGGRLALDATLGNAVSLVNGGTLYFDTTNSLQVYEGLVTGDGNMLKTGTGTLSLLDPSSFTNLLNFTGGLGADEGRLEVSVASLASAAPNVTKLVSEGKGEVALFVTTDDNQPLALSLTGDGTFAKTGDGKLVINDTETTRFLQNTGAFAIEQGVLGGTFATSGDLVIKQTGTLAPGNSPGLVTVNGNLISNGGIELELTGSNATPGVDFDRIDVNGAVTLGAGTVFTIKQFGATAPRRGVGYKMLTATGGIFAVDAPDPSDNDFKVDFVNGRRVIIVTPQRNGDTTSVLFGKGATDAIVIYDAPSLANFSSHDGLSGLIGTLDGFVTGTTGNPNLAIGKPINDLGGALAFASEDSIDRTVNALSPLGYASLYAMSRDTALRHEDRIKERLEQRRYDRAGYTVAEWETFVVGSAAMATNSGKNDTPYFNYNTYGGLVGLDRKVEDGLVVGGAAGYDNGSAKLHRDAGKIEMNRVRGTAFMSTMVSKNWFVEGGLSAGFGDFSSKRETVLGRNTGSTTGFDLGANINTGTIIVLAEDLHLTPFIGVSYAHHEFQGFTEKGPATNNQNAALKVDGWSQDSLRASIGSGLGWWLPAGDWKWKLGVDASFNHELLDTDSDIKASFANLGGGKFTTKAAALPSDSISVGPNAALHFDDMTSVSAGVTFEYGFDGRTYTGLNIAFRRRF